MNHIKTIVRNKNLTKDNREEEKNVFYKMEEANTSIAMTDTNLTTTDLTAANMRRNGTSQGNRRTTNFFMSNNQNEDSQG